jgi:beta-glucosidase
MDMASQTYTRSLANLVSTSKVNDAQLDALVLPILETKYELGLFEHPYVDESKVEARC